MKNVFQALFIGFWMTGVALVGTTALYNIMHGCSPIPMAVVEMVPGTAQSFCPGQMVTMRKP